MTFAYTILVHYRYRILSIVSLLTVVQIAVLLLDVVSFEHERVLVWYSYFTLLIWMGVAGLLGVISPVGDDMQKGVYLTLSAILVAVFVHFWLIVAGVYWHVFWGNGLPILVWIGVAGLIGAFATADRNSRMHKILVVFSLNLTFWAGLLMVMRLAIAGISSDRFQIFLVLFGSSCLVTTTLVGAIAFRTVPADKPRGLLLYIVQGLRAFGIIALACVLHAALFFTAGFFPFPPYFEPLLLAVVISLATTKFIGTMRHGFGERLRSWLLG